jgi:hypothetical protein
MSYRPMIIGDADHRLAHQRVMNRFVGDGVIPSALSPAST